MVEQANADLAARLIAALGTGRPKLVVYTSSTQERLDNPYGRGKRRAGEALAAWGRGEGECR